MLSRGVCSVEKERERRGSGRWSVTFLSPLPFCAVAARGTRRYDDINLTCTRMHCYDNVFKCQPVGTSKGERWSGTHTSARAVSFRADVSTRTNPTNPRPGRLQSGLLRRCSWPATCLRNRVSDIIPCRETNCYFISHLLHDVARSYSRTWRRDTGESWEINGGC